MYYSKYVATCDFCLKNIETPKPNEKPAGWYLVSIGERPRAYEPAGGLACEDCLTKVQDVVGKLKVKG